MLNRFYFLDHGDDVMRPEEHIVRPGDGGIPVAHVIDGRAGRVERLLEHKYSSAGDHPFCLVFRGSNGAALARQAMLLLFHPAYVVAEKGKPVFVEEHQEEIAQLLNKQRLDVEVITMTNVKQLHAEGHDPAGDYYRYCLTTYSPDDVLLLSGGKPADWVATLNRVDHELAVNHERFYLLAAESRLARLRAAAQEREIVQLREERKTMQELRELSSKHDEVNYILNFYTNEYEILPLWYKRLGHVIKVIQGKRSFRSLFDKRVKKYKD